MSPNSTLFGSNPMTFNPAYIHLPCGFFIIRRYGRSRRVSVGMQKPGCFRDAAQGSPQGRYGTVFDPKVTAPQQSFCSEKYNRCRSHVPDTTPLLSGGEGRSGRILTEPTPACITSRHEHLAPTLAKLRASLIEGENPLWTGVCPHNDQC